MPAKRTQRKIRNKRRKVGRKSRRVKKKVIGGGKYSLKKDGKSVETISIDSIDGASFYNGTEELYKISKIDNQNDPKSIVWAFDKINQNSLGFSKTNIKEFLKKELPYTHLDFISKMQEQSTNKDFISKFSARISDEIEEKFLNIDGNQQLKVVLTDNNIIFNQENQEKGTIKYISKKDTDMLQNNPNSLIKLTDIKNIFEEIVIYYNSILNPNQ